MAVQPHLFGTKRVCSRACNNELKRRGRQQGPGRKRMRADGYVDVYYPDHPDVSRTGYVLEHRLVAEQKYGRRLLRSEHVHHLNGVRDDNRPDNLEVISASAHARESNKQQVAKRKTMRERRQADLAELAEYRRRFGPLGDHKP
jgi:hypothetical protein